MGQNKQVIIVKYGPLHSFYPPNSGNENIDTSSELIMLL